MSGRARRGAPRALLLGIALALLVPAPPVLAQSRVDPFPPAVEQRAHTERLRAPGLRSGPRLPLGAAPRTDYGAVLAHRAQSTPQPLFLGLLAFYRTVVSPVNGSNSDLAPVPSLYAVQAIHAHGVLLGSVLTTARLIQEPSVIPHAPRFREGGRDFYYDPLPWNTYWLPTGSRGD